MAFEILWLMTQILFVVSILLCSAAVVGFVVYVWRHRQRRPVSRTEQRYTEERSGEDAGK